jgi:3-dehydrotetronate 4-kinase
MRRALRVGCIADDFTGATDLANTFVRGGLTAVQLIGVPEADFVVEADADVIVIALKSRTIEAGDAVAQSLAALEWLRSRGAERIYFKVCSTFDSTPAGNIGPVTEALMAALGSDFAIVTPAFPENGRTVFKGHLFVGEALLSESGMRHHPLTPMTDANLVRVLQAQSRGQVGLIDHRAVAGGKAAIGLRIDDLRTAGVSMAIADATSDDDLQVLGAAAVGLPLVTAGSGLAAGLARALGGVSGHGDDARPAATGRRAVVAGSCSFATQRQVQVHREAGHPTWAIDPLRLDDPASAVDEVLQWFDRQPPDAVPLIHSTADAAAVQAVQARLGMATAGERVEAALSRIAAGLVARGVRQLVVAGGETSGACVQALGVRALRIGAQIAPGVPWCHAEVRRPIQAPVHLALKSGNFGGERFFADAFERLSRAAA